MKQCPYCGQELNKSDKQCSNCGNMIPKEKNKATSSSQSEQSNLKFKKFIPWVIIAFIVINRVYKNFSLSFGGIEIS